MRPPRPLRLSTRLRLACALLVALAAAPGLAQADPTQVKFRRVPTQYIAALGDPQAHAGTGAQAWGLWPEDPGPRGVDLAAYPRLQANAGIAPAKWTFDRADWWLEEHGLIMEQPRFPLPPGRYLVTGDRAVTTMLTVHATDKDGNVRWELADGATLHDVTHLACRSARYRPANGAACTPARAKQAEFPVHPGAEMPPVEGCAKQDYAVLIVVGVAVEH